MNDMTKLMLCASLDTLLTRGEIDEVREHFDTEKLEATYESLKYLETASDEYVMGTIIAALKEAFPEAVKAP